MFFAGKRKTVSALFQRRYGSFNNIYVRLLRWFMVLLFFVEEWIPGHTLHCISVKPCTMYMYVCDAVYMYMYMYILSDQYKLLLILLELRYYRIGQKQLVLSFLQLILLDQREQLALVMEETDSEKLVSTCIIRTCRLWNITMGYFLFILRQYQSVFDGTTQLYGDPSGQSTYWIK